MDKAGKFLRDRGRKRKRNRDSEKKILNNERGRSQSPDMIVDTSSSERTLSDTEINMVRRRTERRKKRYGFDRDQPSSSRRPNQASEKMPSGSYHRERQGIGSHFSMESRDSLHGWSKMAAAGSSSLGRHRGIPMGNDVRSKTKVLGPSKSWLRGKRVKEAAQSEKFTQSDGAATPRTDPDFLVWKKLLNKELGYQALSDNQIQNQEEKEEEEVQVFPNQRHISRGWDLSGMVIGIVGENVDETFMRSSAKLQKTRGRPRKAPVQKALVNVNEPFRRSSARLQKMHKRPRKVPVKKAMVNVNEDFRIGSTRVHNMRGRPRKASVQKAMENVNEAFKISSTKQKKTRGRTRKAYVKKVAEDIIPKDVTTKECAEETIPTVKKTTESEIPRRLLLRSDPNHGDLLSSETNYNDEHYMLGLSEDDVSEISLSDEDSILGDIAVEKASCAEDVVKDNPTLKSLKKTSSHCVRLADVMDRLVKDFFNLEGSALTDGNTAAKDIIPEDAAAKESVEETIPTNAATNAGNAQVERVQEQIFAKGHAQESITAADDCPQEEIMMDKNVEGDATAKTIHEQVNEKGGTMDVAETPPKELMMDTHDEEPNTAAENITNIMKEATKDAHDEPLCYTVQPHERLGKAILMTNGDEDKYIPLKLEPERQSRGEKRGKSSDGKSNTIAFIGSSKKPHQPRNTQEPVVVVETNINSSNDGPQEDSKIPENISIPQDQPSSLSVVPDKKNGNEVTEEDGTEEKYNKKKILVPTQKPPQVFPQVMPLPAVEQPLAPLPSFDQVFGGPPPYQEPFIIHEEPHYSSGHEARSSNSHNISSHCDYFAQSSSHEPPPRPTSEPHKHSVSGYSQQEGHPWHHPQFSPFREHESSGFESAFSYPMWTHHPYGPDWAQSLGNSIVGVRKDVHTLGAQLDHHEWDMAKEFERVNGQLHHLREDMENLREDIGNLVNGMREISERLRISGIGQGYYNPDPSEQGHKAGHRRRH